MQFLERMCQDSLLTTSSLDTFELEILKSALSHAAASLNEFFLWILDLWKSFIDTFANLFQVSLILIAWPAQKARETSLHL